MLESANRNPSELATCVYWLWPDCMCFSRTSKSPQCLSSLLSPLSQSNLLFCHLHPPLQFFLLAGDAFTYCSLWGGREKNGGHCQTTLHLPTLLALIDISFYGQNTKWYWWAVCCRGARLPVLSPLTAAYNTVQWLPTHNSPSNYIPLLNTNNTLISISARLMHITKLGKKMLLTLYEYMS